MKHLFIFLTVPFFLSADQDESINTIYYHEYKFDSWNDWDKTIIVVDGHLYRAAMLEHCEFCPCCD